MPFCPNCGREYVQGATFCPNCGKPFQVIGTMASEGMVVSQTVAAGIRRPLGVTILAVLQILGSITVLGASPAAAFFLGPSFFLGPFAGFILAAGFLSLIFALGLFSGRNWARILMLIGAVLDIISIVGIVWGIIILWYFTRPHVVAYFKQPK